MGGVTHAVESERQSQFDALLAEFLQSYVPTPVGQEHRQASGGEQECKAFGGVPAAAPADEQHALEE